jgi:hypothetical protein
MDAIDQELLEQISRGTRDTLPPPMAENVRSTGEHQIVDDGKMTIVMDAIDPAALGLEPASSGEMAAVGDDEEEDSSDSQPIGAAGAPTTNGGGKKKRRKKRR